MANTRGRTNYKPVNYRAGMAELRESQAGVVSSLKQEKADTRYRSKEKTAEQEKMTQLLTSGISGISNAMRQKKQDDQLSKSRSLENKRAQQDIAFNESTKDARQEKIVSDSKISQINLARANKTDSINDGMMAKTVDDFKIKGGKIPEGTGAEEAYGMVQSSKAKIKEDLDIQAQEANIANIKDDNVRADKQLALQKSIAGQREKEFLAKNGDKLKKSRNDSGESAKAVDERANYLSNNPAASHRSKNRSKGQQKDYDRNTKEFDSQVGKAKARETSRRSVSRIFKLGGVEEFLKEDGSLTAEGAAKWDKGGLRGLISAKFGDLETKSIMKQIENETQLFLKAAAQDGTFGALNFAREIERAMSSAGADGVSASQIENLNMSSVLDDFFGSSANMHAFAATQSAALKKDKDDFLIYLNTGSYGEQDHRRLMEAARSLGPISMVTEGNDNYIAPGDDLSGDPSAAGMPPGQAMMNNIFGHKPDGNPAFSTEGQFGKNLALENFWESGKGRKSADEQLAQLEIKGLSSDKAYFTNRDAMKSRLASNGVYTGKSFPKSGMIASSNGTGQVVDAATMYPNGLVAIDSTGNPVSISSPSGVNSVGATSQVFDKQDIARKNYAVKNGFESPEHSDKAIFSSFGESPEQSNGGFGTAYAN